MRMLKPGLLFGFLSLLAVACSSSANPNYVQDKNYRAVPVPQTSGDPKRITVEEFFWYGCPHCYHLEPELNKWLQHKPADVDFVRVPDTLGHPIGELHERAFYVAKSLGILDKTHEALFDAIHQPKTGAPAMNSLENIRALYVQAAGIKPEDFDGIANSFMVQGQMQRADDLSIAYGVTGTPTIVVGGKYAVDAQDDMLKVVDFVIDKVRKERK